MPKAAHIAEIPTSQPVVTAFSNELRSYADRGIFSNFSLRPTNSSDSLVYYCFNWLAETPFQLRLNPVRLTLELQDLLPAVPFRSEMDKAFRAFLKSRCAESVPAHRRLHASRFAFKCSNKQQKLSVTMTFRAVDAAAAARCAVNLIHEVFNNFLQDGPYQNYMIEVFNTPEE